MKPRGIRAALLALVASAIAGCATTVVPPSTVTDPAQVGVLDHGRHASLIIEVPGSSAMIRYSYGDWRWYALGQTGFAEGASAILRSMQAGVGQRQLAGPFSPSAVFREVREPIEEALFIEVEADSVRALMARLDGIFSENVATRIYNPDYDLEFVHHPEPYGLFHNSNRMVGNWLVLLGCEIEGRPILSAWKLGGSAVEHGETEQAGREQGEGRRFTDHAVRRTEIP